MPTRSGSVPLPGWVGRRVGGHQAAGSAIAGLGVYAPPASALAAPFVQGQACRGVSHRVRAAEGISTPSLAAGAARAALAAAGIPYADVGLIVVATTSPDVTWPTTACLVQNELGLPMVGSFDLSSAQAGLVTALSVADCYVAAGLPAALVIGAESDNQLVDLPAQPVHRGRAASAIVLRRADPGDPDVLACVVGGAATRDGAEHEQTLLHGLSGAVERCLQRVGVALSDIDLVIGEQTAPEVMRAWAQSHPIAAPRLLLDPGRYRPALTAAPLIALRDAVQDGRLRPGETALLISCGRGPAWAVACLRWGEGGVGTW